MMTGGGFELPVEPLFDFQMMPGGGFELPVEPLFDFQMMTGGGFELPVESTNLVVKGSRLIVFFFL